MAEPSHSALGCWEKTKEPDYSQNAAIVDRMLTSALFSFFFGAGCSESPGADDSAPVGHELVAVTRTASSVQCGSTAAEIAAGSCTCSAPEVNVPLWGYCEDDTPWASGSSAVAISTSSNEVAWLESAGITGADAPSVVVDSIAAFLVRGTTVVASIGYDATNSLGGAQYLARADHALVGDYGLPPTTDDTATFSTADSTLELHPFGAYLGLSSYLEGDALVAVGKLASQGATTCTRAGVDEHITPARTDCYNDAAELDPICERGHGPWLCGSSGGYVVSSNISQVDCTALPFNTTVDGESVTVDICSRTATLAAAATPDLTVGTVSAPAAAASGGSISVSGSITNAGLATPASSVTYFVLRSADTDVNMDDTTLQSYTVAASSLDPGETYPINKSVPLGTTPAGSYYIGIYADGDFSIPESSDTNNANYDSGALVVAGIPDLTVGTVSVPSFAAYGGAVPLTASISNRGAGTPPASVSYQVLFSTDTSVNMGDPWWTSGSIVATDLEAGETRLIRINVPLGTLAPGTYYVGVYADGDFRIAESNNNNNANYDHGVLTIR